jgi:putative hydrolase of the HAD superfamily
MSTSGRAADLSSQAAPRLRRRPRAVFLDAGNTLLHLDYELIAGMLSARAPGAQLSPETVRRAEWRARVRANAWLAEAPGGQSTESRGTFRQYMTYLCDEAGLVLPPARLAGVLDELADYQQAHNLWRHTHPFARRVMADLQAEGCRLGVISNAAGDVKEILAGHDLAEFFDAIIDSALVGVEKPDPAIFELALRQLGVAASEAIHVGDLPAVDVAGAQAVGMEAVLIDPLGSWLDLDCVKVRDLTALPELVRRAPRSV